VPRGDKQDLCNFALRGQVSVNLALDRHQGQETRHQE